ITAEETLDHENSTARDAVHNHVITTSGDPLLRSVTDMNQDGMSKSQVVDPAVELCVSEAGSASQTRARVDDVQNVPRQLEHFQGKILDISRQCEDTPFSPRESEQSGNWDNPQLEHETLQSNGQNSPLPSNMCLGRESSARLGPVHPTTTASPPSPESESDSPALIIVDPEVPDCTILLARGDLPPARCNTSEGSRDTPTKRLPTSSNGQIMNSDTARNIVKVLHRVAQQPDLLELFSGLQLDDSPSSAQRLVDIVDRVSKGTDITTSSTDTTKAPPSKSVKFYHPTPRSPSTASEHSSEDSWAQNTQLQADVIEAETLLSAVARRMQESDSGDSDSDAQQPSDRSPRHTLSWKERATADAQQKAQAHSQKEFMKRQTRMEKQLKGMENNIQDIRRSIVQLVVDPRERGPSLSPTAVIVQPSIPEPRTQEISTSTSGCAVVPVNLLLPSRRTRRKATVLPTLVLNRKLTKHKAPERLEFETRVRDLVAVDLGRGENKPSAPLPPPPSRDSVERYRRTGHGGPTRDHFRVDYEGGPGSAWNVRLAQVFAENCIEQAFYGWTQAEYDDICEHFRTNLKTIISHYRQKQAGPALSSIFHRKEQNRRMRRAENLHERRVLICSTMHSLRPFLPHIWQMGKEGMSDDEDAHEHGERIYRSSIPHWRSREITIYVRILDLLHLSTKFDKFLTAASGNWPRVRTPSQDIAQKPPVGRLPRNFYNSDWLETLSDQQIEALSILPDAEFSHTEEDLRIAYQHMNIRSRNDQPDRKESFDRERLLRWVLTGES
ncbi:hypothetical protein PHLGIDRAFT_17239, partial [Phlebiopsis gigantea 11061_1 CR5-6]